MCKTLSLACQASINMESCTQTANTTNCLPEYTLCCLPEYTLCCDMQSLNT